MQANLSIDHVVLPAFGRAATGNRAFWAVGVRSSDFVAHGPERRLLYFFDPNGHPFELTHRPKASG